MKCNRCGKKEADTGELCSECFSSFVRESFEEAERNRVSQSSPLWMVDQKAWQILPLRSEKADRLQNFLKKAKE